MDNDHTETIVESATWKRLPDPEPLGIDFDVRRQWERRAYGMIVLVHKFTETAPTDRKPTYWWEIKTIDGITWKMSDDGYGTAAEARTAGMAAARRTGAR